MSCEIDPDVVEIQVTGSRIFWFLAGFGLGSGLTVAVFVVAFGLKLSAG